MSDDLAYFFGGYFHEDWMDEAARWNRVERGTWQGVVRQFVQQETDSTIGVNALAELSVVVESPLAEGERLFEGFNSYYWPFPKQTMSEWLVELRDVLADELLANDKVLPIEVADIRERLDSADFVPPPIDLASRTVELGAIFGASEPLSEVFELLADLSILLSPSMSPAASIGSEMAAVRAAVATSAVSRWERTAPYLL